MRPIPPLNAPPPLALLRAELPSSPRRLPNVAMPPRAGVVEPDPPEGLDAEAELEPPAHPSGSDGAGAPDSVRGPVYPGGAAGKSKSQTRVASARLGGTLT